ncbi:MAG: hypothetical protein A3C35_07245 [Omnitrophica bacterium RIFCSPHIGHO2_02_FULL_46_11]|nr:MAG: hypothetical protein A3C35_07245 [Omnitrophica bacterium RIFCSPHIGHO2_02_FULL_46_11]OGW87381.1 MAG: hypothetical protein A3A81_04645 [Omnitrophica bacterium RIFCSPLOWO2_01_FULL_45_10b]
MARSLGPASRGMYAIIVMLNQYLISLLIMGMGSAAEMQLAKKEYSLSEVHSFAICFSLVVGGVAMGLFLALRALLFQSFLRNINPSFCFVSVLLVPLVLYSIMTNKILIGINEIPLLNVFKFIRGISDLIGLICLLLIVPMGVKGALTVWVISMVLMALIQSWWLFKLGGRQFGFKWRLVKESLSFGGKVHLAFLPAVAIIQLDTFVLNYFHGAMQVGLYAVVSNAVTRISFLFSSVLTAAQAKIIGRPQASSEQLVRGLIRHSVFAAGVISLFLFVVGRYLILLFYGKAFAPSVAPLVILSIGMIAGTVTNFMNIYAVGQLKRPGLSAIINWGSFFLGGLLYFTLIPRFGLLGTAWASVVISFAKVAGYLWLLGWFSLSSISEIFVLRTDDLTFWKQKVVSLRERFAAKAVRG